MIRSEAQRNESVRERLLEMLLRQKEKFAQYLDLLRREGNSIASGNAEQLQLQLDRENAANRAALQAKMAELKSTIAGLRVLPKAALSPMASPGIVDVTA
jgi:hypothetical protein